MTFIAKKIYRMNSNYPEDCFLNFFHFCGARSHSYKTQKKLLCVNCLRCPFYYIYSLLSLPSLPLYFLAIRDGCTIPDVRFRPFLLLLQYYNYISANIHFYFFRYYNLNSSQLNF